MDKKAYNLKRTFEQPIVMYEFTDKIRFNKGIRLDFWGTFFVLILIETLLFFAFLKPIVMSVKGLPIIYFLILPYYATKYLVKLKQDGKKLYYFLVDFIKYVYNIQFKKVKYCYDDALHYATKKITFK
ncbi:conjugal transfer protein [Staphylococcus microti]|uniref:Conjugal transfer protein n=1 Tax=Staphylococcus microti TaxID=569857 RepID=A0A0D6XQZ6_9STAP|nr:MULTISPECIES: TcpE family conjugal transfer membrane protein [Staphylococcus]KIX91234.1 conjugal transfer protein [Staphylococcus microti]PNZ75778.1 conjugal transfer protein [Staphylococcus microti]SUM58290.1 transposon-related protein [Staphylococcus microti]